MTANASIIQMSFPQFYALILTPDKTIPDSWQNSDRIAMAALKIQIHYALRPPPYLARILLANLLKLSIRYSH